MHLERICRFVSLPAKLKLMWERIALSRLTRAYFIFSVIHCVIQVTLQINAFTINATAASFLSSVLTQGNASIHAFPVFGNDGELRLCDHIPSSLSADSCTVIWDGTPRSDNWLGSGSNSSTVTPALASAPDSTPTSSSYAPSSPVVAIPTPLVQAAHTTFSRTTVTITVLSPSVLPSAPATNTRQISSEESENLSEYLDGSYHDGNYYGKALVKQKKRHSAGSVKALEDENGQVEVILTGILWDNTAAVLDSECLWALTYPVSILRNTKREDIVFIAFQFWVLGMSTVALLNESIPHILASLLTHMLATAWAAFQIRHTSDFRTQFIRLTTDGACKPLNMLPTYWKERGDAEIPSLALNAIALLISAFLTWRLVKLFGWQTFKRVGASLTINRVYKIVLTLSITIQLSLFFMIVTVALWIDQLFNGEIAQLATLAWLYKVMFTVTLVLLVPWLMTGWFAARREFRIPMMIFLVLSIAYLAGWAVMFLSDSFRWTFVQWRFFSLMAIASVLLTLAAFVLGVFCRINFGKGLSRYLNAQQPVPGDDFVRSYSGAVADSEKVDLPSRETPIPTFSVTFGPGPEVPPPSQMRFAPRVGPRFYNPAAPPFESQGRQSILNLVPDHTRNVSNVSYQTAGTVDSNGTRSARTYSQSSANGSLLEINSQRWVIE